MALQKVTALLFITALYGTCQILRPPSKSTRGQWFPWARCPNGTYTYGFELKSDPLGGEGLLRDETLVNAVRLYCSDPKSKKRDKLKITGGEGPGGYAGKMFQCNKGAWIVGFKVALAEWSWRGNDTAVSNLAVQCSDGGRVEGDGPRGGHWTEPVPRRCSDGKAVCAIRSQLKPKKGMDADGSCVAYTTGCGITTVSGIADDSALNNVEMGCCAFETRGQQTYGTSENLL